MTQASFDCYECDEDDCNLSEEQLSICENAIYCWKSTLRDYDNNERNARGCITKPEHVRLVCGSRTRAADSGYRTECCGREYCNGGAFPVLDAPENPIDPDSGISTMKLTLAIVIPLLTIGLVFAIAFCYQRTRSSSKKPKERLQGRHRVSRARRVRPVSSHVITSSSSSSTDLKITPVTDSIVKEYLDGQSLTSGSGSGRPLLTQSTLSKTIALVETLNNGSFGPLQPKRWRAIWQGENVMVKVYSSRAEVMWAHETEFYTKLLPSKHDNILGYIGSDTTSMASCTQLWIITCYHPNGSLDEYLKRTRLDQSAMLKACVSLAHGLLYLHTEINGTKGKLAMVHRNLSSKNVFVKMDGGCVIGSFEYAATQERLGEANFLVFASKRYMSPELLEPTFEHGIWSLEGFQQADMYSLSLIFWEICRMCVRSKDFSSKDVSNYVAPFSEWLGSDERDPTIEEMRQLILIDQRRPDVPAHWQADPIMNVMSSVIQECWHTSPSVRLPILRVKKTILKLANG